MAQWRNFAATGQPDTCLWCGHKLRRPMVTDLSKVSEAEAFQLAQHAPKSVPQVPAYDKPGDYGDGFFCGLRCGYMFGVRLAELGRRLQ